MNTKMRMRMLSFLLCFVMLVGLMPTTALAAEETTVTTYEQLWSAIYSNDDYCITLGSDITYEVPDGGNTPLSPWQYLLNVDGTKNKTIDLNGNTLQVSNEKTSWPTQSGLFNIDDTASLTVMNGTIKLYNYNTSNRTDIGVFNARGGYLTLTNVDVLNGRNGTAVNAQGDATVNIEGGTISANNGFAVTAVGTSWLTLDKNVTLTTTTGSGLITQPADNGYGSLHASTSNLTVVSAMFEAGIEVAESTISQFSASANRLVFVGGTQYNSAFATSKSGDYYWDTNATGGCALVVNDNNYSFAKNVNVISTTAKQPVVVTNGTASPNQAAYGATVTITADNIQGKVFSGWTVESGGVTLADSSAKTTTFTMGAKAVEIRANYDNVPISSAKFTVATPVQGGHPSTATTTTEHITVSETWCVEKYDENSFSSTLSQDHTFEVGHTYRVGVVFEVEQGYVLDNDFSVKFADPISSTETPASQGATPYVWIVDYTVENNGVEITSVTATVSGVAAGATAGSTTVTTIDTTYTVSIKGWYDCDNVFSYASAPVLQTADTFVGGKTYTVGVAFTPVGSNTFASPLTASINGESGKIGGSEGNSRNYFITISIPASQPNEYMVSYNANGGSGTMVGDMVEENGKFTLENCTYIAPEGYKFKAWAIGSVNGEQKQPGEQITITGETYIYAIWEAVQYNISVTDGTSSTNKATMGTTVTLTANAAPSGKTFSKWVVNGVVLNDANAATTTFVMPANDVTATATYKDIPVITNPKPQNVKATAGDGKVTLTWDKVDGANAYAVYKIENGVKTMITKTITSNTYIVTGLTNGTSYGFSVRARVGTTWSDYSDVVKATPKSAVIPANVKATAGNGQITMTWDKVSGATKYAVYSYLDGKYTTETTTEITNSYTVTGLTNGTKYGFKVKAYVDGKWSAASAIVYATPVGSIIPENLKIANGDGKVQVTWDKVSGATRYAVYSYLDGVYITETTTVTGNTYTVTGLTNGTKYGFKVKAYVDGKWSTASAIIYARPSASTAPGAIKAIAGSNSAEVQWSGVIGATRYAVYKYENGVYTCINSNIKDTSYTVTGLTGSTKYGFKVKAYVDGKWSAASVIAYATPTA